MLANLRLYLDEDSIEKKLIATLKSRGYQIAFTTPEIGWDDCHQLEEAIRLKYTVFSYNIKDFSRLHKQYMQEGRVHYGIIVAQQGNLKGTLRRLFFLLETLTPDDMLNHIEYLSSWKR